MIHFFSLVFLKLETLFIYILNLNNLAQEKHTRIKHPALKICYFNYFPVFSLRWLFYNQHLLQISGLLGLC